MAVERCKLLIVQSKDDFQLTMLEFKEAAVMIRVQIALKFPPHHRIFHISKCEGGK